MSIRSRTIFESGAYVIMVQLIDKIGNERSFGVSSDEKVPLNVLNYINSNGLEPITKVTSEDLSSHHLATLIEINNCKSFDKTNRAYHMHAADNLVVGFDIEPRCWSNYLAYFATLPAHYREYSMHNGIHLLYELDRTKLLPAAVTMIATRTEYKFKDLVNNQPLEFELMFNNHWLTLTKRVFGKQDDLSTPVPEVIYQVINEESLAWEQSKRQVKDIELKGKSSEVAKKICNLLDISKVNELKELTVADFKYDDSYYEYNIALRIAGALYQRLYVKPKPMDAMYLGINTEMVKHDDFIWATALLLESIVPKRDKDNEERDGLPWLVYTAKQACLYILADNNAN